MTSEEAAIFLRAGQEVFDALEWDARSESDKRDRLRWARIGYTAENPKPPPEGYHGPWPHYDDDPGPWIVPATPWMGSRSP